MNELLSTHDYLAHYCLIGGAFVVLLALGAVVRRKNAARSRDRNSRYLRFPKNRQVLLEKGDAVGCARACATNPAFRYQIPELYTFENTGAPGEGAGLGVHEADPESGYAFEQYPQAPEPEFYDPSAPTWKQEAPLYVHPTAPDNLPLELWFPEELTDDTVPTSFAKSQEYEPRMNDMPGGMPRPAGNEDATGARTPASVNAPLGAPMQSGMSATIPSSVSMSDSVSGVVPGSMPGGLHTPSLDVSSTAPLANGMPVNMDTHSHWAEPETDPLSDIESMLFPPGPGAPANSANSPPFSMPIEQGHWNSPPEMFVPPHPNNRAYRPSNYVEGGATPVRSPPLTVTVPKTANYNDYLDSMKQYSAQHYQHAPNSRDMLHARKGMVPHAPLHHNHQTALPSPPHSARGGSDSGSDTNDEHLFKCSSCSATFRIRGYLTRHMKKHAEIMKFNCPFHQYLPKDHKCHQTGGFSRRDTFKMHLKARHFAYPSGTARKNRPNCAGKCCGCNEVFENNELWIENHLLAGKCPMDKVHQHRELENTY